MGNKLFGTDGVRGVANTYPITADFALKLAYAAGCTLCTEKKKVAIAKDTRLSSDMLEAALTAGFTAQGVDVLQLGVIPTPALTKLTPDLDVDMAVMITASHNPFQDNGIKLISANGDKLADEVTAKLEAKIAEGMFSFCPGKTGKVQNYSDAIEKYIASVMDICQKPEPLKGLKVVLDCANGCFSQIMPQVFKKLGAEVTAVSCEPDGINVNLDCGSQHPENMAEKVCAVKADLGIAADGDGDRIIICDEKGHKINGDQILAFLGHYFKENNLLKADTVVVTIVSNPALDRFLEASRIKCVRASVGERYVIEEMKKCGSNLGGEESGHMVIADYAKSGDTLITALVIALGLQQSGKKMSDIFPMFTPMLKHRVDSCFKTREEMQAAFERSDFQAAIKAEEAALAGKGRMLVRKSGTEPKIQVWVWADDNIFAADVNRRMSTVLEQFPGYVSCKQV